MLVLRHTHPSFSFKTVCWMNCLLILRTYMPAFKASVVWLSVIIYLFVFVFWLCLSHLMLVWPNYPRNSLKRMIHWKLCLRMWWVSGRLWKVPERLWAKQNLKQSQLCLLQKHSRPNLTTGNSRGSLSHLLVKFLLVLWWCFLVCLYDCVCSLPKEPYIFSLICWMINWGLFGILHSSQMTWRQTRTWWGFVLFGVQFYSIKQ